MLRIDSIVYGLLMSCCFSVAAGATTIKTNLDNSSGEFLFAQFGTTPTYNQRQQETFHRDTTNYLIQLDQQQDKQKFLSLVSELSKKKDYVTLGTLLYSRGYTGIAFRVFNDEIRINPRSAAGYFGRAIIKSRHQKDLLGALADFDRAIEIDPENNAGSYYNRAIAKKNLGNTNGAIQDFRQAAQFYRSAGNSESLRLSINQLNHLGATE
jgi:tetratricopeptide (TPR) repeat protein